MLPSSFALDAATTPVGLWSISTTGSRRIIVARRVRSYAEQAKSGQHQSCLAQPVAQMLLVRRIGIRAGNFPMEPWVGGLASLQF